MAANKIIKEPHYLGVCIEKKTWNKLRKKALSTQDSVSKLIRNAIETLVKDEA